MFKNEIKKSVYKTKLQSSEEDKHVGLRLMQRRMELGISQTRLAKFENLTFQQLQKYEKGKNRMACGRLYRFSKILHVSPMYFFEGLDNIDNEQKIEDFMQRELVKLNRAFLKIPSKEIRTKIISLAKSIGGSDE